MAEHLLAQPNTTKWLPQNARGIVERIVVKGQLILKTPAHFGGGDSSGTEMLLTEDALEHCPLLPGASIAGALRSYLLNRQKGYGATEGENSLAEQLFGVSHEEIDGMQSRVIVDDAYGHNWGMEYRDGVKLSPESRTAEDQKLFSMQVWSPGTVFELRFELLIYEGDKSPKELKQAFAVALSGLSDGSITLGARKRRGYGSVVVEAWTVTCYDMQTVVGLVQWLHEEGPSDTTSNLCDYFDVPKDFVDHRAYARVDATFTIDGSLLIRSGSDVAEMAHLTSNGLPVLSGTAIAGALRARAFRIFSLFSGTAEKDINDLFGPFGEDSDKQDLTASRLLVSEQIIDAPEHQYGLVQSRVKIDRFTGGAYETALFDQQPVFGSEQTLVGIVLEIRNPQAKEIGLLLLLLKDLWSGDLALGGESSVGRGRLCGRRVHIMIKDSDSDLKEWTITSEDHALCVTGHYEALEEYMKYFQGETDEESD